MERRLVRDQVSVASASWLGVSSRNVNDRRRVWRLC